MRNPFLQYVAFRSPISVEGKLTSATIRSLPGKTKAQRLYPVSAWN
jgi:hypothetical protein